MTTTTVSPTEFKILAELLESLIKHDPDFIKQNWREGTYQVWLKEYWLVVSGSNPDELDFMRLDRAIRSRIIEKGWHYGLGITTVISNIKLARICIPASVESEPTIPRPLWIWESHENEDAIALLRAYVKALEKIAELRDANNPTAA